jgi:hypothetical protein
MSQSTPINQIRKNLSNASGNSMPQAQMMPPQVPVHNSMDMGQPMPQSMGGQPMPQIPSEMNQQAGITDSQLVNDILKEMGDSPGADNQADINVSSMSYAMDSSQVPPEKLAGNFLQAEGQETLNPPNTSISSSNQHIGSDSISSNDDTSLTNKLLGGLTLNQPDSWKDKLIMMVKYPLLVLLICIVISLPIFSRTLFSVFPNLLKESGEISLLGVLLKSVIGAFLFAIIQYFV